MPSKRKRNSGKKKVKESPSSKEKKYKSNSIDSELLKMIQDLEHIGDINKYADILTLLVYLSPDILKKVIDEEITTKYQILELALEYTDSVSDYKSFLERVLVEEPSPNVVDIIHNIFLKKITQRLKDKTDIDIKKNCVSKHITRVGKLLVEFNTIKSNKPTVNKLWNMIVFISEQYENKMPVPRDNIGFITL